VLNVPESRLFEIESANGDMMDQPAKADDRFIIICHGAIEERYGHDTMLQAITSLKSSVPRLQLRIMGWGSYREKFLDQVEAMGLQDHVQYLGYVPLEQLVEELRRADVGIIAQKASAYSHLVHTGKMYDYLAFGKPVIASRLRAVQAYFDDGSLCFFEPGDAKSLAKAMLDLYQHPEKRQSLIENSQKRYNQYKWQNQRENYLDTYRTFDK